MFIDSIDNRPLATAGRHVSEAVAKHVAPLELMFFLTGLSINMPPCRGWCDTRYFCVRIKGFSLPPGESRRQRNDTEAPLSAAAATGSYRSRVFGYGYPLP